MRSIKEIFSKQHNTSSRSKHIDYDYLDQLSDTEKDWLAKFTENYYSASFDINPAFVKKEDLIKVLVDKISRTEKSGKWLSKLEVVKNYTKKFYQVSSNLDKKLDIDLRIIKGVKIFYKKEDGRYTTSKYYKYSQNNVIDPVRDLERKDCTSRGNAQNQCVMSKFGANSIDDYELELQQLSPEDIMIENEEKMKDLDNSFNIFEEVD